MKKLLIVLAALAGFLTAAPTLAATCSAYPYTLTNGTTADANQVMSNFNTISGCVNNNVVAQGAVTTITSITGMTTPLSVGQGGTGLATITAHGVMLGEGTSAVTPITGTSAQMLFWQASGDPAFKSISGDCTTTALGAFTCTTLNGVSPGTLWNQNAPTGSTQCLQVNSSGTVSGTGTTCGNGSPGGSSAQIQYNNGSGGFAGSAATATSGGTLTIPASQELAMDAGSAHLTSPAAATFQLGAADAASPVAQTVKAQSVVAGTSNTAGASLTIAGSKGTGTGVGGSLIFQTAPAGTSGTAQNAQVAALTIDGRSHLVPGGTAPTVTSCGVPLVGPTGTDTAGKLTLNNVSSCQVVFNHSFTTNSYCIVEDATTPSHLTAVNLQAANFTVTLSTTVNDQIVWICMGD